VSQMLKPEWIMDEHQRGSFSITGACGRHLPRPEKAPKIGLGECSRCGECCRWVIMPFAPSGIGWDEWYFAHGIKIEPCGLMIPSTCQHLKEIRSGVFECEIYDDRPQLCRLENYGGKYLRSYRHKGCTQ
jgi:hypothetical protein